MNHKCGENIHSMVNSFSNVFISNPFAIPMVPSSPIPLQFPAVKHATNTKINISHLTYQSEYENDTLLEDFA
jgi:hypothetical protein